MKTESEQIFTERLNYCITKDGKYIGTLVNIPSVTVQADNLEELERKAKIMAKSMLKHLTECLEHPFNSVNLSKEEMFKL